ncbi:MAG: tryptophan synthase subunit alpha [Rickettsiales bacterium]
MTTRIEQTFKKLKTQKRSALIPFIMGCDPDMETSAKILMALPTAGADIVEIGMPFSDPMADGAVIQAAGIRALSAGATVMGIIKMVREFRANNNETPIILMGYFNPIYRYGVEKFCADAVAAGVDGVIIVDLPPEEEGEIRPYLTMSGLKLIRLIAPTSGDDRIKMLADSASGFMYYISITGITGTKTADSGALKSQIEHVRQFTKLPVAVGFGIKTPQQVNEVSEFSDAVVVGSALVDIIAKSEDKVAAATKFVETLTGNRI